MSDQPKRVVVIGGTGHFGGRICRRLLDEPACELIVTSRSIARAEYFVAELRRDSAAATVEAASLDQAELTLKTDLAALNPDIVIHTAGPYQGQDYRVAKACIEVGAHYIDLADGREFVAGFSALDAAARAKDVLLVSGASTLPGISSVVIDSLRSEFASIESIETSIAPAHQTPRGPGTVAAVLSYCGAPIRVLVDGAWTTTHGWQDLRRFRYPQLGARFGGACDVPDLALLPDYVTGVRTVTFHAALEATWEQLALWSMGWATRAGVVRNWGRYAPSFHTVSQKLLGLGTESGGMQMTLRGQNQSGGARTASWNLVAHKNHGPEIPCSPALIIARQLLTGRLQKRGAHACLGFFTLADLKEEMSELDTSWETTWSEM